MSTETDHFVVANSARIPCTIRTLRPFFVNGDLKPWVHSGELSDALLYLAKRAELPASEISALKELLENLSSSLSTLSAPPDHHQGNITPIKEQ
nr:MAG: hypothetical protein [Microvirus sp.]